MVISKQAKQKLEVIKVATRKVSSQLMRIYKQVQRVN
jgi:hypothetical protein